MKLSEPHGEALSITELRVYAYVVVIICSMVKKFLWGGGESKVLLRSRITSRCNTGEPQWVAPDSFKKHRRCGGGSVGKDAG